MQLLVAQDENGRDCARTDLAENASISEKEQESKSFHNELKPAIIKQNTFSRSYLRQTRLLQIGIKKLKN